MVGVSVALCTHNGSRFVAEQVRSILAQSRPADEIVVSDDASTDDTVDIIEAVFEQARREGAALPELRVLRNDRAFGVTKNFEQALSMCRGDLVALCDQDDLWHPDKLAVIVDRLESQPGLLAVSTDARLVGDDGKPTGDTLFRSLELAPAQVKAINDGAGLDVLIRRNIATGATMVVRRGLIDTASPFPPAWVHDEWLAMVGCLMGGLGVIEEQLIDYRVHGGNQIGVRTPTLAIKVRRVFEPRGDRNRILAERARMLVERAPELTPSLPGSVLKRLRQKADHEAARAGLPDLRVARILPVLREMSTGRYRRYSSQGLLDVLRDLLQPAH